ncbi:hypothetical protein B0H14DRAFT_2374041 [Mycena olivaceomarginata]|nr:hypothetical protein B0H14DRAFT_2374041 [Mycena olivaceomarginata]
MKTIFSAQVLDLWDLHLTQHQGLFAHSERLASQDKLPTLDNLISEADAPVHRYASDTAFETALSSTRFNKCPERYKFQTALSVQATDPSDANCEFTGDQVLANTIAFRRDILLYTELSDAISDGDIGRVCEVLKLLIFFFAGASKQNCTSILLDVYCLFKFEATNELKDAIWNNWLVSLTEELGKCHGGSFDDPFFRQTISPNVDFFQRLKEEMQEAFGLKGHRKTHTSPSVTNEIRMLMDMYR